MWSCPETCERPREVGKLTLGSAGFLREAAFSLLGVDAVDRTEGGRGGEGTGAQQAQGEGRREGGPTVRQGTLVFLTPQSLERPSGF